MAVWQAIRLVETETISLTWDNAALVQRTAQVRPRPPRTSTARVAVLAAGLARPIAAALRSLLPEQETQP